MISLLFFSAALSLSPVDEVLPEQLDLQVGHSLVKTLAIDELASQQKGHYEIRIEPENTTAPSSLIPDYRNKMIKKWEKDDLNAVDIVAGKRIYNHKNIALIQTKFIAQESSDSDFVTVQRNVETIGFEVLSVGAELTPMIIFSDGRSELKQGISGLIFQENLISNQLDLVSYSENGISTQELLPGKYFMAVFVGIETDHPDRPENTEQREAWYLSLYEQGTFTSSVKRDDLTARLGFVFDPTKGALGSLDRRGGVLAEILQRIEEDGLLTSSLVRRNDYHVTLDDHESVIRVRFTHVESGESFLSHPIT